MRALRGFASFHAVMASMLAIVTFAMVRPFVVDPDLWWHLRTGELLLTTRQWPIVDTFSFTAQGLPWIATEWFAEVLFAAVYRMAGIQGLAAILIAGSVGVVLLLFWLATLRSGNSKAAFVAVFMLLGMANGSFNLRPQMIGFACLVITLICLEYFRRGRRNALWWLPPMFLVWINTHGSWIVGLGVVVVHLVCGLVDRRIGRIVSTRWTAPDRRYMELALLLCLVAIVVTPYGTELARYPFEYTAGALPIAFSLVAEWQPMQFNMLPAQIFLVILLGFFALQMLVPFEWRLEEVLLFFAGTYMAFTHVRFLLVFVPFFVPLLAVVVSRGTDPYDARQEKPILNAGLVITAVTVMVAFFPARVWLETRVREQFPVGAAEFMKEHGIQGRILNDYSFGGYLIWSGQKVFVDGRGDLFEHAGVLGDFAKMSRLEPGTKRILDSYRFEAVVIGRGSRLAAFVAGLAGYRLVFSDAVSVIYVQSSDT